MKVLFAVSDDKISEAIVKEYKNQYKEIITYKNVYYFNAIIKEIERDQIYDRIVISEELEPFTNNNYDAIDKFMFEKLDNISDEITRNTAIVLICIDRRSRGETLLSKIFGIGLYNALMGKDRNIPEVCRLLRNPRSKKEAKIYYGLDNDEIEYQKETENSVAEVEIQNILAHYKRLGKNEEKYVESFNNISEQYNDTQLRLIIKYLPLNVKAVLETQSDKYQSIMTFSESAYQQQKKKNEEKKKNTLKMGFIESKESKNKLSSPVIVPSAMNKEGVKKLSKKRLVKSEDNEKIGKSDVTVEETMQDSEVKEKKINEKSNNDIVTKKKINAENKEKIQPKEVAKIAKNKKEIAKKEIEDRTILENKKVKENIEFKPVKEETIKEEIVENPPKRGRGRPRKQVVIDPEAEQKPKRGRGRPRKNPIVEEKNEKETIEDEDDILKVVKEDDELINAINKKDPKEELETDDELLPDFEDEEEEEEEDDDDLLSGFEEEEENDDELLSDFEDEEEDDDDSLLGFEEEEEDDDDSLLGFEDEEEEDDDDLLSDFEEEEEDDDSLLGFEDEEEDDDDLLSGFEDEEEDDDDSLLGFEDEEEEEDDSLLGFDDEEEDDDLLSGFDDEEDKEDNLLSSFNDFDNIKTSNIEKNISVDRGEDSYNHIEKADFSNMLTSDKRVAAFVGTSKNGTSFLVNNLAMILSEMGVKTAILDMTKNKNSYYIFTKNEEDLRKIAYSCFDNLKNGIAQGISVNRNLTVYTALPGENQDMQDINSIIPTLIRNHNVVLIDCDFETPYKYFVAAQEIYMVQSMDILTIQPLTYFLKELKNAGINLDEKGRVIINKEQRVKNLSKNAIIGGISSYNDPAMSYMTKLFDKDKILNYSVPLDIDVGAKYLETLVTCELSLAGYSRNFIENLKRIAAIINPAKKGGFGGYNPNNKFSNNMNSTLDEMKRKY